MGRGASRGGRGGRGGGGGSSRGGRGGKGGRGGPREAASSNADEGMDFGGGGGAEEAKAAAKRKSASQDTHRSGRTAMQREDMYDEVDDFMDARHGDKIALDRNAASRDDDDDDEPAYLRAKGKGKNKHSTAFELEGLEPDEDEDEEEEEEEAPDFDAVEAMERAEARKREIAAEENISKSWGKSKNAYYSADTADFELHADNEIAMEEEAEGRRLQSKTVAELAAHTDEADDMLAMVAAAEDGGDASASASSNKQSKKQGKAKSELPSDAELLQSFQDDMDGLGDMNLDLDLDIAALTQAASTGGKKGKKSGGSSIAVERITKDLSRVSEEDKLAMVHTSSPELVGLLESFKNRLAALQETMTIWEDIKEQQELKSTPWYAFVSFKVTTLLLYCSHVSFYLSMKAKGKSNTKNHEIMNTMAKLEARVVELDGLDEHFATQRALEETNDEDDEEEEDAEEAEAEMLDEDDDGEDEHLEDDDQEDDEGAEDDDDDEDQFPEDAPLDPSNLAQADLMSRQTAALSRLLEGVSAAPTKPKKKQAALAASAAKHRALSDFGEVDHRAEMAKSLTVGKSSGKLAALQAKLQAEQAAEDKKAAKKNKKRKPSDADDEDPESKDEDESGGWGSKSSSSASKKPRPAVDVDASEAAKGAALYAKVAAASKEAKALKASVYEPQVLPANWKTMSEDERRAVSKQINANRGLVRSRPKDRKNPKTANRLRYEKKMVARSGAVQVYKGSQEANYGGQATGIKTTLTKSISLRG